MVHTVSIRGEVLGRDEIIVRLQQIADVNKENVWIGRNLKVIENTWYQRIILNVLTYLFNFEWCGDLYNVDDKESNKILTEIGRVFIDDRELIEIFNKAVTKFNEFVSYKDRVNLDSFEFYYIQNGKKLVENKDYLTLSSDRIQTVSQLEYLLDQNPSVSKLYFGKSEPYLLRYGLSWDRNKVVEFLSLISTKYSSRIKQVEFEEEFGLKDEDLAPFKNMLLNKRG
ncbi:MAG: hypothetical protein P4L16_03100 [Chlamydiales bacterium]|nr:hypothetical protein [Chlamydiales bacterium]